ncbi:hypothetical protein ACRRTK_021408 [Alexandromys fortis]
MGTASHKTQLASAGQKVKYSSATTKEAETEAPPVQGYSRRCGKWQRKGFNRLIKETRCPRKCASKECDHPLAQKLPLELASSTQPGPSNFLPGWVKKGALESRQEKLLLAPTFSTSTVTHTGARAHIRHGKRYGFDFAQLLLIPMSWHPQYRSSKFRHVYGKPASKENCYDSVPITRSVHDNHFCAVNPHFIAVVTECAGGGAFLVIPLHQSDRFREITLIVGSLWDTSAEPAIGRPPEEAGLGERGPPKLCFYLMAKGAGDPGHGKPKQPTDLDQAAEASPRLASKSLLKGQKQAWSTEDLHSRSPA